MFVCLGPFVSACVQLTTIDFLGSNSQHQLFRKAPKNCSSKKQGLKLLAVAWQKLEPNKILNKQSLRIHTHTKLEHHVSNQSALEQMTHTKLGHVSNHSMECIGTDNTKWNPMTTHNETNNMIIS